MEKTRTYQKRSYTPKDIKKKPKWDQQDGQSHSIGKSHTTVSNPQMEKDYNYKGSAWGVRCLSPTLGSPSKVSASRGASRTFGFEDQQDLFSGDPEDYGK